MRHHAHAASLRMMLFLITLASTVTAASNAGQTVTQLERDVQESLRGERDVPALEVNVEGTEVTLRGRVPTLWVKSRAIEKTLEVKGVETVVAELEIPAIEDDAELIQEVAKVVFNYPYYTVWDYLDGTVNQGVVTLRGSVLPGRDKPDELFERVAKVPGVQDVLNTLVTQSPSSFDAELRNAIALRVFQSSEFGEFANWSTPPFHILVDGSSVRLLGFVRSELDKTRLAQIVRTTNGVIRLVNDLQISR